MPEIAPGQSVRSLQAVGGRGRFLANQGYKAQAVTLSNPPGADVGKGYSDNDSFSFSEEALSLARELEEDDTTEA